MMTYDYDHTNLDYNRLDRVFTELRLETPSWGYGNAGTRFNTYFTKGSARTTWEKIDDAAEVNKLTGIASSIALHIPWDDVADWAALKEYASERGLRLGAVNPNLFQDQDYRLGSLANPDAGIRDKAIHHVLKCIEVMKAIGSKVLSLWLADGTNYMGQDDLTARRHRLRESLKQIYLAMPEDSRLLVEYKFFEPSLYYTDIADWGKALLLSNSLGPQAQVLVDMGHHPQGTNLEAIVSTLLDQGKLGGFHFNARHYADDDLIVGSTNPLELFAVFHELILAAELGDTVASHTAKHVAYMIDQAPLIEPDKVEAMILSVLNVQEAYAKASLVDRTELRVAQEEGDILAAHRILISAFSTDVRQVLSALRQERGLPANPLTTYRSSGYRDRIIDERGTTAKSTLGS